MSAGSRSRFDADKVLRLIVTNEAGRLEMHLTDMQDKYHIVSLPLPVAVALGRLICDLAEGAPFLVPGVRPPKSNNA